MKKTMMIAAALCAVAVTQVNAMSLSWAVEFMDADQANDVNGLVQLYAGPVGGGTLINQDAENGVCTATATFGQTGVGSGAYLWNAGQQFYFKVYDGLTTVGTRTITTTAFTMPSFPSSIDTGAADALQVAVDGALSGGTLIIAQNDPRWVSVPEPASMALFGIGAGVLALRRRMSKKAA